MGEIETIRLKQARNKQYYNIIFQTRIDLRRTIKSSIVGPY